MTTRSVTLLSCVDHHHGRFAALIARDAALRHQQRIACAGPARSCARTNMPGSSSRCGFGKIARSTTAPVPGSTDTSENCSLPALGVLTAVLEREAHLCLILVVLQQHALGELALQAQQLRCWTA